MTLKAQYGKDNQDNFKLNSNSGDHSPVTAKMDSPISMVQKTGYNSNLLTAGEIGQLHRDFGNQAIKRMLGGETTPSGGRVACQPKADPVTKHSFSLKNRSGLPGWLKTGLECLSGFVPVPARYNLAPPYRMAVIQTKLEVGPAGDQSEQEADRAAGRAMRLAVGPAVTGDNYPLQVQLKPSRTSQDSPLFGPAGGALTLSMETMINQARGGGQTLPDEVRGRMERAYGADFSGVRVHTGEVAERLNRTLHSRAFTIGPDLFIKPGEYRPGSSGGQRLIAHELAHVLQQNAAARREVAHSSNLQMLNSSPIIQRDWEPIRGDTYQWSELLGGLRWYYYGFNQKITFMIEDEARVDQSWRKTWGDLQGQWKTWCQWMNWFGWDKRDIVEFAASGNSVYKTAEDNRTILTTFGFGGCIAIVLIGSNNKRTLAHIFSSQIEEPEDFYCEWGEIEKFKNAAKNAQKAYVFNCFATDNEERNKGIKEKVAKRFGLSNATFHIGTYDPIWVYPDKTIIAQQNEDQSLFFIKNS